MSDDDGDLELGGFLAVDNLELGTPSMGGIRLGPDIGSKVIHDLTRGMTLKNAAAGLPYGRGKSGIVASRDLARAEYDDVVRGFARLLTRYRNINNPGPGRRRCERARDGAAGAAQATPPSPVPSTPSAECSFCRTTS